MNEIPLPLILLGVGVGVVALSIYLVISTIMGAARKRWDRRINGHDLPESGILLSRPAPVKPTWTQRFDAGFEGMIQRTGLGLTSEEALGFMALLSVVLTGVLILWRDQLWLGLVGLTLGIGVPLIIFWVMQARYRRQLQNQLPDAFYMLARALRAGLSLEQALDLLAEQGTKPLSDEFRRCTGHIRLGLTAPAALQLMADRLRLLDFNAFVSAVGFQRTSGGNLALLMDRLAASTRDHNQFRGHLLSATAQPRFTAMIIACAGPLFLLIYAIWQPPYIQSFFETPTGWLIVGGAVAAQLIAALVVYNILRVEY